MRFVRDGERFRALPGLWKAKWCGKAARGTLLTVGSTQRVSLYSVLPFVAQDEVPAENSSLFLVR